nr:uncharacterized protein LOC108020256 isoform X2 [Drosophila suzukii]XP_036677678.1 uncharacterized protein LOC118878782 isoform X2 [Drosophila suzukii]
MEEKDILDFSVKRKREYFRSFKWTTEALVFFVKMVWERVKDCPEKLEKPTAKFYQKVVKEYTSFRDAGVQSIKTKMNYGKSQFIKAIEWRNQTGGGLLEKGDETSVES